MRLFFLYLRLPPSPTTVQCSSHFISSIRSSSVYHRLLYPAQQATFPKFSDLEQCCLYTFINHFRFDSVFNPQNKTKQYYCMNLTLTMHACTNFFKILQGSSNSWTNMCYIIKMQRVQGYQIWHSLVSWRSWRPWRSWRSWTGHISFEDILHFRIYYIYIYIYIYIKIFMYIYNFNVNVNDLLNTIFYFSKSQFLNSTYLWT